VLRNQTFPIIPIIFYFY